MVDWLTSNTPVPYAAALATMEARAADIRAGTVDEAIWLFEHPPLYTAGTSARAEDLTDPRPLSGPRGAARRAIHLSRAGPARRSMSCSTCCSAARRAPLRRAARGLGDRHAGRVQCAGRARAGRVGVWVVREDKPRRPERQPEEKIAAIGIRLRKWVSFHGISINVEPDLSHFDGIVPCGIGDYGVTSLVDLGLPVTLADVDAALMNSFGQVFSEPS